MHANETHADVSLVRRLLAAQFPSWGTDNALYRLGAVGEPAEGYPFAHELGLLEPAVTR